MDKETMAVWIALVKVSKSGLARIETALEAANLPSLSWYDALLEIEKAGADGIRPYTLVERLLLPQYGTSRLLKRIEAAGLIKRLACKEDRRGYAVGITAKGSTVRAKMWPVYSAGIKDIIEQRLDVSERAELKRLLGKMST